MIEYQTIEQTVSSWKHVSPTDWSDWRWQIRNGPGVEAAIDLAAERYGASRDSLHETESRYRFRVTPYYLSLADIHDPADPILRQCMPDPSELSGGGEDDPFDEDGRMPVRGLVHRFPDRALLIASSVCAVYCRHCTRKNSLDGGVSLVDGNDLRAACDYIAGHLEIREVILSGGDPLLLDTARLAQILCALDAIDHVEVVRIGTRVPVVLPFRVDYELCAMLKKHRPLWINTQFNHPAELTPEAIGACRQLQESGIPVSNQLVLLKGVNDSLETLHDLCTGLQRNMIRPYYAFVCDPVQGVEHMRVSVEDARELENRLRECVGGLCLPRFVQDNPFEPCKTVI